MARRILVTGGNTGIGFALCMQLATEHGCHVLLGARNAAKGAVAVESIKKDAPEAHVELVLIDTSSDESVAAAAEAVRGGGGDALYAIVNNAGTGLAHGVDAATVLSTNLLGPKRVCEAFGPLLDAAGRIVNVGSGAGPMFVARAPPALQALLCDGGAPHVTWAVLEAAARDGLAADSMGGYGVSKACLAAYTALLAREHPALTISCVSPGFIDTAICAGFGATKPPSEGTVSIVHCLFAPLEASGWYFGSDAVRSPLHFMRNPGEPPYDGQVPVFGE